MKPNSAKYRKPPVLHIDGEEWRAIPNHPGYEASSLGRIKSIAKEVETKYRNGSPGVVYKEDRILLGVLGSNGYLTQQLPNPDWDGTPETPRYRKYCVNRLVFAAFHRVPEPWEEVDHDDLNRTNNRPENLKAMTVAKNRARRIPKYGESSHYAKLTEADVIQIRIDVKTQTHERVAMAYGVVRQTIGQIAQRKTWSHIP